MKLIVTGAGGQLGRELIRCGQTRDFKIIGLTREALDVTSAGQIESVLTAYRPEVIVNAAAYTKVDDAEENRDAAFAVNAAAAGLLADWCRQSDCILVHVSTDYVFDGKKHSPYVETDPVNPLNVYGASKARGEAFVREKLKRHLIVRTSWLYSAHGRNFFKTIIALAQDNDVLRIVSDQFGSPTSTLDLSQAILALAESVSSGDSNLWGTYHYCCRGVVSWHDFAAEITRQVPAPGGRTVRVDSIPTSEYPTAAKRPAYSALDSRLFETAFSHRPRKWTEALKQEIARLSQAM